MVMRPDGTSRRERRSISGSCVDHRRRPRRIARGLRLVPAHELSISPVDPVVPLDRPIAPCSPSRTSAGSCSRCSWRVSRRRWWVSPWCCSRSRSTTHRRSRVSSRSRVLFPGILLSPIAGALLDRHGRVRLIILDYLVAMRDDGPGRCARHGGVAVGAVAGRHRGRLVDHRLRSARRGCAACSR